MTRPPAVVDRAWTRDWFDSPNAIFRPGLKGVCFSIGAHVHEPRGLRLPHHAVDVLQGATEPHDVRTVKSRQHEASLGDGRRNQDPMLYARRREEWAGLKTMRRVVPTKTVPAEKRWRSRSVNGTRSASCRLVRRRVRGMTTPSSFRTLFSLRQRMRFAYLSSEASRRLARTPGKYYNIPNDSPGFIAVKEVPYDSAVA
jgi:hypothetical protein